MRLHIDVNAVFLPRVPWCEFFIIFVRFLVMCLCGRLSHVPLFPVVYRAELHSRVSSPPPLPFLFIVLKPRRDHPPHFIADCTLEPLCGDGGQLRLTTNICCSLSSRGIYMKKKDIVQCSLHLFVSFQTKEKKLACCVQLISCF